MALYRIHAVEKVKNYYHIDIEAESLKEAIVIAEGTDPDDFEYDEKDPLDEPEFIIDKAFKL